MCQRDNNPTKEQKRDEATNGSSTLRGSFLDLFNASLYCFWYLLPIIADF